MDDFDNNYDLVDTSIYTEVATGLIYEVKFFDGFVLARPATPMFYCAVQRISDREFQEGFEVFAGDADEVRLLLWEPQGDEILIFN